MTRKRSLVGFGAVGLTALALSSCMVQNGTPNTLTFVGSDTTQEVIGNITSQIDADADNADPDNLVNILAQQTTAKTAPADANCAAITYHTPPGVGEVNAPNGSGAGRDALKASVLNGDGCIDVARSSGTPRGTGPTGDLASFEYYAYALDAVSWASASTHAPANLSLNQLKSIYNCTITDWSGVGGTAGPIKRYWPQAGSGTRSFFQAEVLGFDPTTFSNGVICPAVTLTEENSGSTINTNGDLATAIVPFSAANWVGQAHGAILPDIRFSQTVRSIDGSAYVTGSGAGAALNTAGPVTESNVRLNNPAPANVGVRYVFNVIDKTSVNYGDAKFFVGFENAPSGDSTNPTASKLCKATYASTITTFGFAPLDATISAHNQLGSNCRLYTN